MGSTRSSTPIGSSNLELISDLVSPQGHYAISLHENAVVAPLPMSTRAPATGWASPPSQNWLRNALTALVARNAPTRAPASTIAGSAMGYTGRSAEARSGRGGADAQGEGVSPTTRHWAEATRQALNWPRASSCCSIFRPKRCG